MDNKRFSKDMGAYIRTRRKFEEEKGEVKITLKKQKPIEMEEVPILEGEVVEYETPGFWRKLFSGKRRENIESSEDLTPAEKRKLLEMQGKVEAVEEEMKEIEEMEEELEVQRESLIDKIAGFLGFGARPSYEEIEDFDQDKVEFKAEMDEDTKEVLKIMHSWLEKLSAKNRKAFKESEDFPKYKEALEKYGLIKKK